MVFGSSELVELRDQFMAAERRCELHEILIEECGEKLAIFPRELSSPYYARHFGVGRPELFLRMTVAEMVLAANQAAEGHGYQVVLYDGYRDNILQQDLFDMYLALYTAPRMGYGKYFQNVNTASHARVKLADLPQDTKQAIIRENTRYVALPSNEPNKVANHRTGGAADVWLYKDGVPCDLGVVFDHMDEESGAFYQLEVGHKPWPTGADDQLVTHNRTLLLSCMIGAGFTVYPYEIWHFDYGNQRNARIVGGKAKYGIADNLLPA